MPERKSLCAQLPIALYNQVTEAREALGMTTNEYVTRLITEYFQLKKNGGTIIMASNRTMLKEIFWTMHEISSYSTTSSHTVTSTVPTEGGGTETVTDTVTTTTLHISITDRKSVV